MHQLTLGKLTGRIFWEFDILKDAHGILRRSLLVLAIDLVRAK
jgi:hypothetical protein